MKKITATFKIVTPMFLGDAEQNATSIRPPSVKGALRFWWRALNWKRAVEGRGEDEALVWLHNEEAMLFGHAADESENDKTFGQGIFLLKISKQPTIITIDDWPPNPLPISGSTYLGFGITESGSPEKNNYIPHRQGIKEGETFELTLIFKPSAKDDQIKSIYQAMEVFGTFGGLGSRNRRGFGSVTLQKIDDEKVDNSKDAYKEKIRSILSHFSSVGDKENYPPYSAFSSLALATTIEEGNSARAVHNQLGNRYKDFRKKLSGEEKLPFGIPLQKISANDERRASPLLFHIHELNNSKYIAVACYLPSKFHPHYPKDEKSLHSFYSKVRQFMQENSK